MRKKLLLSCLSVIVLAALGIGANADMFKPYERYEIPVETADIIVEEMQEDEGIIEETIETNGTKKEETIVVTVADKKSTFSSEGEKEEKQVVDTSPVNEGKTQSNNKPPKKASNDQSSAAEPVTPKPEPTPVPDPKPVEKPSMPEYACPAGMDPNKPCDVIMDTNFYYSTYSSQSEADNAGQYFLDDVVNIGDKEITNYSVQPVYRNDGSVAYYGLNLWSYGSLIQ
ncbi:hypothetical protein [Bulleidia sp. HCP3S3_G12]|uniref:hypothetical protein n=1 Tax=Bulleidia sp. HCP3S3_G12 TaxID=3438916 RepID=UPI003F89A626